MFNRYSYGVVALLATTALSQPWTAAAQEADSPATETATEDEDRVLGPVVVRGQFIPDEKRETSEVSSLIDTEDFAIRGDSDVAAALRRVTGVSIDSGGKFIYVRGLNERYSSSLLNGSLIPSPEPLRKVAPLDLFPTSVLESTLVQKTFSPSMPGEFAGGVIDIRTRALPNENFLDIGIDFGGNSEVSFQDGLLYDGGEDDWTGYDDGTRDLPAGLGAVLADGAFNNLPRAEGKAFSADLTDNSSLLVVQEGYVGPDVGADLTFGRRIDVNDDVSVGVLGTIAYANNWSARNGETGGTSRSGDFIFDRERTTNNVQFNGFGSVGVDIFDDHQIKFLALGTRSTDKTAQKRFGETADGEVRLLENLEWVERELWTTQLSGEHVFPQLMDLEINWRGSYSEATRDAPYQVLTVSELLSSDQFQLNGDGTSIEFSNILDDTTDFAADAILPLTFGDMDVDLKAGYAYQERDREAQSSFFAVPAGNETLFQDPTDVTRIVTTEGLRADVALAAMFAAFDQPAPFTQTRSISDPAFYIATQEIDAGYFGVDAQLTPFLRAAVGARYEDFIQVIETRESVNSFGLITPPLEESSWMPAATVTWNFADDLQLRLGYSETVNRPQFREVGPSSFSNTETGERFIGNPLLEISDISNYDARLEWYFGREQFVTVGLFYKDIENAIEAINVGQGESALVTYLNIPGAEVRGFEIEYQQQLDLQNWLGWDWLGTKDFAITTNYTYSDSEIDIDGELIVYNQQAVVAVAENLTDTTLLRLARDENGVARIGAVGTDPDDPRFNANASTDVEGLLDPDRQLQGLSEHLFNLQIGYRDEEADADLNFLVNFQSERIRSVESLITEQPATIEEPPLTLDFVYRKGFNLYGGDYTFGLKVQNILNSEYRAYQTKANGTEIPVDVYDPGTSFSLSLSRSF